LGGLFKFSGTAAPSPDPDVSEVSYLADWGAGIGDGAILTTPPSYPVADPISIRSLATNVMGTVPEGGSVLIELLKNGVAVPAFSIGYSGTSGILSLSFGVPVPFAIEDTFDLRVTTQGVAGPISVTATLGWIA
jgi:hypothetical protein